MFGIIKQLKEELLKAEGLNYKFARDLEERDDEILRLKAKRFVGGGEKPTAQEVIRQYFEGDVGWYDYMELKGEEKNTYIQNAQNILRNPTYINEANHHIADLTEEIAKNAQDMDKVMFLRANINAIIAFKERLETIQKPEEPKEEYTEEELNEPI